MTSPTKIACKRFSIANISVALIVSFSNAFFLKPNTVFNRRSFIPTSTHVLRPDTAVEMVYKKVFVAGGSRGVGRCIVDQLSNSGTEVVALVRSTEAMEELNDIKGVKAVKGDAFVYKDVENTMDGCDAAITTMGGMDGERRVDYEGNNHVIEAAGILGISRCILVTSIGCGDSKHAAPPEVFEALKDVLAEKEKAERILIRYYTNMNWTIIRPGGLKSEPATGKAILTEDNLVIGSIHREDVAALVIRALNSPNTERKIFTVMDPSITVSVNDRVVKPFITSAP